MEDLKSYCDLKEWIANGDISGSWLAGTAVGFVWGQSHPRFFCIEVGLFLPTYKAILAVVGRFPRTALIRVGTTYSYHATGLCASETVPGFISKCTMLGFSGDCVS